MLDYNRAGIGFRMKETNMGDLQCRCVYRRLNAQFYLRPESRVY